jgi:hypothetical protein
MTGRRASLLLFILIGGLIGAILPGYRAAGQARYLTNFHAPYDPPEGRTRWTSHDHAALAVPDTGCRPTSLRVRVRSPLEAGPSGLAYRIEGATHAQWRATHQWSSQEVTLPDPESRGGYLRLLLQTDTLQVANARLGVGIHAIEAAAPDTACRVLSVGRHAALGGLLWIVTGTAMLGGLLRLIPRARVATVEGQGRQASGPAGADTAWRRASAAMTVALATVFATWATVKPPTQSPDESDHVVRAMGLVTHPWVAVDDRFCVPSPLATPLVFPMVPVDLAELFFRPDRQLSSTAIARLRALRFDDNEPCAQSHASSYPPLYYAAVLTAAGVAHPLLGLPPWDTFYVMRFGSALLGALAWLPLLLLLRGLLTPRDALLVVLPLALAPMTGFITGAVNPDAVHIPLTLGAGVAWYQVLRERRHHAAAYLLLVAALLTKPPGVTLLLALLLVVPVGVWRGWWSREHGARGWRDLLLIGAIAYVIYYVWSPPAPPGPAPVVTMTDGVRLVAHRLLTLWPGMWGTLGYLDYGLPSAWYLALAGPVLLGGMAMGRRPGSVPTFTWYAVALLLAYAGLLILVQLVLVTSIGPVLQGRYLLPASLAIPLVALAAGRRVAWALLVLVAVGMAGGWHLSVLRYYADGWAGWVEALPFIR